MSDDVLKTSNDYELRDRIAAAIANSLLQQSKGDGYAHRYTPMDDDGNDLPERIGLDSSIDPAVVADAVIAELGLRQQGLRNGFFLVPDPPWDKYRYVTDWADDE